MMTAAMTERLAAAIAADCERRRQLDLAAAALPPVPKAEAGADWTPGQLAIAREMRLAGAGFREIAEALGMLLASDVFSVCEDRGFGVSVEQFDLERKRATGPAVAAAVHALSTQGNAIEKLSESLYRVAGQPMRPYALLEAAGLVAEISRDV